MEDHWEKLVEEAPVNRRKLMKLIGGLPLMSTAHAQTAKPAFSRVRPGDPNWPADAQWQSLKSQLGDQLIRVQSPLDACAAAPGSEACNAVFKGLKNPHYIRDNAGLTQTSGWVDAWTSKPSVWA